MSCYHAGLRIISNLDEVAFVQNLVFYIEAAYKVAVNNSMYLVLVKYGKCTSFSKLFIVFKVTLLFVLWMKDLRLLGNDHPCLNWD